MQNPHENDHDGEGAIRGDEVIADVGLGGDRGYAQYFFDLYFQLLDTGCPKYRQARDEIRICWPCKLSS